MFYIKRRYRRSGNTRGTKVALVSGFQKIEKRLAVCRRTRDSAMRLQWRAEIFGEHHRRFRFSELSVYVSELVKRIRLRSNPVPAFGSFLSGEDEIRRIVEKAHGLHIVTALSRQNP